MLQRALSVCAVLGFVSAANAGVLVTLVPSNLNPQPGDTFTVDVLARLDGPTPENGATSVRLRLAQFDLSDTSPQLNVQPFSTHPDAETPFRFWDFTSTTNCQNDPSVCGDRYFIDGELVTPPDPANIFNVAFTGTTQNLPRMLALNTTTDTRLGRLQVTLPTAPGNYVLDVLNDDETNENLGADLRYGFGITGDPSGQFRAFDNEINYGNAQQDAAGGLAFAVPEPATLALLGLGGLAAAFRRRKNA